MRKKAADLRKMPKNHKPTAADHWFLCTVEFVCPACGGASKEILPTAAENSNPDPVGRKISEQKFNCQLCKKELAQGTRLSIDVLPTTLESIRKSGLRLPEIFDSPEYSN